MHLVGQPAIGCLGAGLHPGDESPHCRGHVVPFPLVAEAVGKPCQSRTADEDRLKFSIIGPLPSLYTVASGWKNHIVTGRMNTVEQVEAEIRRLPRKARQQVAERLNAQLWPIGFAAEVETAWADAVKRRLDDMDSGRVQGVPSAQVFARARQMLVRR